MDGLWFLVKTYTFSKVIKTDLCIPSLMFNMILEERNESNIFENGIHSCKILGVCSLSSVLFMTLVGS